MAFFCLMLSKNKVCDGEVLLTSCTQSYFCSIYTVSAKKLPKCFFVISSIKLGRFPSYFVGSFLNKFAEYKHTARDSRMKTYDDVTGSS